MPVNGSSMRRSDAVSTSLVRVESDIHLDAARALEMLHVQLISTLIDPYWWKWVLVGLHHSLETFLVAALARSETPAPPVAIGEFDRAIGGATRGAESAARLMDLARSAREKLEVTITPELERDLALLAEYRDAFLHRLPANWTLQANALPRLSHHCMQLVDRLGWNPGFVRWPSANLSDRARVKLLASLQILEALEEQYRRQSGA